MTSMSDVDLIEQLKAAVAAERRSTAAVLALLGEVDARELYLPAACSSMHVYCVRVLGMSEDGAYKRIRAARVARRFPVVLDAVADGRLHLSGVVLLAPHLDGANVAALVAEAAGKSKAEIEVVLARRAPKPDVPARLERVAEQASLELAPGPVARCRESRVAPLAPERFALQVTISGEARAKLARIEALFRHQVPSGDLAEVLERAFDAAIEHIEGRRFGKTEAPRPSRNSTRGRYVPREVRREVVARDGLRCSFMSDDGRRCEEEGFLELDHARPVAQGGQATTDNIRVLCRRHNQYEAKRIIGEQVVEDAKAARQREADLVLALRRMGVTASDARRAVAEGRGDNDVERLRSVLAVLRSIYSGRQGSRCEEARSKWGRRTAASLDSSSLLN